MVPPEQVLHILEQHNVVWCGILAPKTLQALAVVLQEEKRLISQHQIWLMLVRLKDRLLAVVLCSLIYCHLGNDADAGKAL